MSINFIENFNLKKQLIQQLENKTNTIVLVKEELEKNKIVKEISNLLLQKNIVIYSIKELQQLVFVNDNKNNQLRVIAEDKRTFAFYQCLIKSIKLNNIKKNLKIGDYFQSIKLAQEFYNFFEEINEELISKQQIENLVINTEKEQEKLDSYFAIKDELELFLNKRGLTDLIYIKTKQAVEKNLKNIYHYFDGYDNVIFYDIYAENKLMSYFLTSLLSNISINKTIDWLISFDVEFIDKKTFMLNVSEEKTLLYNRAKPVEEKSVTCISGKNDIELQLRNAIILKENHEISDIVDFDENNYLAKQIYNNEKFKKQNAIQYIDTRFYVYLDMMYKLINGIKHCESSKTDLIDIFVFFDCINTDDFICYYFGTEATSQLQKVKNLVVQLIRDNNYIYVDIDFNAINDWLKETENENNNKSNEIIKQCLQNLSNDIKNFREIQNLEGFKKYLEDNIIKNQSLYKENNVNVLTLYFTGIEDILTIESSGIVDKSEWKHFFNQDYFSVNFIKLLLDYLKSKEIVTTVGEKEVEGQFNYSTRLNYDSDTINQYILLTNVNDGIFPNLRVKNEFFSEKQREKLGLETVNTKICKERLYFYKLIQNNKNIFISYIKDQDTNKFESGIISELRFYCQKYSISFNCFEDKKGDVNEYNFNDKYYDLLNTILNIKNIDMNVGCNKNNDYLIEFVPSEDFKNEKLTISPSGLKELAANPEQFYYEKIIGLKEFDINRVPVITDLLLGNIVHEIYAKIVKKITENNNGEISSDNQILSLESIKEIAQEQISTLFVQCKNSNLYKVPDDFNKQFLEKIIFGFATDKFIHLISLLKNDYSFVKFKPEEDYEESKENKNNNDGNTKKRKLDAIKVDQHNYYKGKKLMLIPDEWRSVFKQIELNGRADLIVESGNKELIIDYKSGKSSSIKDDNQLLIYKYTNFGVDTDEETSVGESSVDAKYYFIFDRGVLESKIKKSDIPNNIYDIVYRAFEKVLINNKWTK